MNKIKLPPINYKALSKDIEAVRLERKGVHTGRFKPARYANSAEPDEARKARHQTGLDRRDFAEALGVSKKTIESWENGLRHPDGLATKILRIIKNKPALLKQLANQH